MFHLEDGPVYLSITPDGRYLLVANYHSGAVSVLPIRDDGGLLPASEVIQHDGPAGAAYPEAAVEGALLSVIITGLMLT